MRNIERRDGLPDLVVRPAVRERERTFHALRENRDSAILSQFTPEQQEEIRYKQQILSSLAYFIGKDFRIPVELNEPGQGWHWNFKENKIRIDPKDLLEKSMDYLRFVICHEGGHRRITRADFIPVEVWRQPGFSFMMNAIEDPRMNNFVAESYPKFREQMTLAYKQDLDFEAKGKEKAGQKLGYQPRFMQAGFEYIRQWFREVQNQDTELSADLPEDVRQVVGETLPMAQDSWWRYPSRQEADKSEELITRYAEASYEINRDQVWPEFKKLVEQDMEDQKTQEFLQDTQQGKGEGQPGQGLPQELKDQLTPEEQKELEKAIEEAIRSNGTKQEGEASGQQPPQSAEAGQDQQVPGKPVNLDSLSEELKQKIREYVESLPEAQREELAERAKTTIKQFEKELAQELQGKLSDNPETQDARPKSDQAGGEPLRTGSGPLKPFEINPELLKYKERLERVVNKDANIYEKYLREVASLIEMLEPQMREIFTPTISAWQGGFKSGKRINIKQRIQEKAKAIPAMESHAWQRRELPKIKDWAIILLVDLSGSRKKNKQIEENFKAIVILAEIFNRLGVATEVLGFNDEIYKYLEFGQQMSQEVREHLGGMFKEVEDSCCKSCGNEHSETDLGWAVETAASRLQKQTAPNRLLLTFSDGIVAESDKHPRSKHESSQAINKAHKLGIKLAGLGLGKGSGKIADLFKKELANLNVEEMANKLPDFIKDIIANYDEF